LVDFLEGKSNITPEFAVSLEDVLQIPARFWMNSQKSYEEYKSSN
jgi:plasmid maintenance system antidote protein VapI